MNYIEKQVRLAIEEFGDKAHEIFWYNFGEGSYTPTSNDMLLKNIDITNLELIPLSYLFEYDVNEYGDNAHLMWEWQYKDRSHLNDWFQCDRPLTFKPLLNYRRKISAALPFDLDRAKAGDVVECYFEQLGWINCEYIPSPSVTLFPVTFASFDTHDSEFLTANRLRMKYPKAVKNEHG